VDSPGSRIFAVSVLLMGALVASPASADSWKWRDKAGGKGPLSIAAVRAGHGSSGPNLTITFDRRPEPAAMGAKDFVVVDVEADLGDKSERWIYLVGVRGRLRTFSYYPKSDSVVVDEMAFERSGRRSVVLFPLYDHEATYYGGHAFAVGSYSETGSGCGRGCWDVVPERGYLIHDYTGPDIVWFNTPNPDPEFPFWYRSKMPVSWRVEDRGSSGIRRVMLMTSDVGTGEWRRAATERPDGFHRVTFHKIAVPAVEGSHVMFRLVAEDGARNVTTSPVSTTRIPYDQANESGPGTFMGLWSEEDYRGAQGGTVHTSNVPIDSLSIPGEGDTYCVILRWVTASGSATLEAGDSSTEITQPSHVGDYLWPYCVQAERVAEQTATLRIQSGRVSVDGYWTGVDASSADDGSRRPRSFAGALGDGSAAPRLRRPEASLEDMRRIGRSMRPRLSSDAMRSRHAH
jgi:hypothetical protein